MPVVEAISVIVHCSAVSRNWGAPLNFWKPSLWGLYAWNLSVEVDSSFQKLRGAPQFLKTSSLRTNAWNFGPFWQGKTPQKPVKKVLWPHDIYKKYLLQKKWVKTAIPALSSGQSNLHQPIWGCHRQLDDHHRNPNNNDRDHLVGQLTTTTGTHLEVFPQAFSPQSTKLAKWWSRMNILFTSVAISQLKCLDYAFFVAKMSKMTFTRFGGQVWLDGGQSSIKCGVSSQRNLCHFFGS